VLVSPCCCCAQQKVQVCGGMLFQARLELAARVLSELRCVLVEGRFLVEGSIG
jgi:hypothetical protein